MPIDLSWVILSRIVRIHIYDDVPLDLLRVLADQSAEYTAAGIAPVHFLLDDQNADPPPANVKVLANAYGVIKTDITKVGWVIGIGQPHPIAKIVVPLFMNILKVKFMRVDTTEEAIAFLKKQDSTLEAPSSS